MITFVLITFTSFQFILTVSGSSLVLKDARHVGCYPDLPVKDSDYYELRHLLTWDECLQVCHHRLTKFAGLQAEHSSSTDNNCFCGNDLGGRPTSAACRPCLDHNDKFCGGYQAMSVYNIRDASPFSVLIATDFGVKLYSEDRPSILSDVANTPGVTAVKYVYDEDEVFLLSGVKIYRSFFDYVTMGYNNPSKISLHDYVVLDFTVDWVQKNIFWMNGDNDYWIYRSDLQGGQVTRVVQRNYFLRNLMVDPYARMLFFVEFENKLYSYSLDNGTLHSYHNGKIHVTKIKKIAVDVKSQVIYVIGSVDEGLAQLMAVDYGDTKARQLYQGPQLTNPKALDVYNGEVVWVNHEDLTYSLYRCKLTPRCQPENLHMAHQSLEITNNNNKFCYCNVLVRYQPGDLELSNYNNRKIHYISIYSPEKQTPGVKYLCSLLGCPYSCESVALFVVKCTCPQGKILAQDMATCQDIAISSGNQEESSLLLNTVPHTLEIPRQSIQLPMGDDETEASLLEKRHLKGQPESSQNVGLVVEGNEDSKVGHFQFFVMFCFLALFLLLSVVIYLQMRRSVDQDRAVTVGHRCRVPEPEDGANTYVEILHLPAKNTVGP